MFLINRCSHRDSNDRTIFLKRIASALFYGFASFVITIINKTILTTYQFPSFQALGIGQMFATILVLFIAKQMKIVDFPNFELNIFSKIWPLPLIYIGNMFFGLGGTKELSLPMFTVLRRFSILMTMIGEYYILAIRPTYGVQISVYIMIAGALVAAANDLAFNLSGYVFITMNNLFTSMNGVYMKKKLDSKELGKYGLMYYNSLFMIVPAFLFAWQSGDIDSAYNYEHWQDFLFLSNFIISCVMGFILSYSVIVCTFYNSALTTSVIGCLKNVCVTYLGMIIGGDYIFSWVNFIGLNLSIIGSLLYTYVTFRTSISSTVSYSPLTQKSSEIV